MRGPQLLAVSLITYGFCRCRILLKFKIRKELRNRFLRVDLYRASKSEQLTVRKTRVSWIDSVIHKVEHQLLGNSIRSSSKNSQVIRCLGFIFLPWYFELAEHFFEKFFCARFSNSKWSDICYDFHLKYILFFVQKTPLSGIDEKIGREWWIYRNP